MTQAGSYTHNRDAEAELSKEEECLGSAQNKSLPVKVN